MIKVEDLPVDVKDKVKEIQYLDAYKNSGIVKLKEGLTFDFGTNCEGFYGMADLLYILRTCVIKKE